jgi:hypothetical protein
VTLESVSVAEPVFDTIKAAEELTPTLTPPKAKLVGLTVISPLAVSVVSVALAAATVRLICFSVPVLKVK